jgi:hypothetical protein
MDLPLWVPWVLALSLALPVALRRGSGTSPTRAGLVAMLVPAVVMALFAAWLSLDRRQISQDELDAAARDAAAYVRGSFGPVNAGLLANLMAADLGGRELWIEVGELSAPDELNAAYTIEVRVSQEGTGPAACFDVNLEVLDAQAPDLRLATVDARSGGCD